MRLFLGLEIPSAVRNDISKWTRARRFPGALEATAKLHITLVFLGEVSPSNLDAVCGLARRAEFPAFDITLDTVKRWPNGILHLAPSRVPPAIVALQRSLQDGAVAFGVKKGRYSTHVTLARDTPYIPRLGQCPPFSWRVDKLVLFSSEMADGTPFYREVDAWPAKPAQEPSSRQPAQQ